MLTFEKIEFRRKRDFGQIFNDSFSFLKQNLKPLARALIFIAGPFYLTGALLMQWASNSLDDARFSGGSLGDTYLYVFFMILALFIMIVGFALQYATIIAYFKKYFETETGVITVNEIWETAKDLAMPLLGLSFLVGLLSGIGFVLCLVPGIYVMIGLSFSFYILGMEGKDISTSFSRSFELIKGHWWSTFGISLVMGLITMIISLLISLPMELIQLVTGMHNLSETLDLSESTTSVLNIVYWLYAPFAYLVEMLLRTLPMMAICLKYFSVVEEKESIGVIEEIDSLGEQPAE